MLMKHGMTRLAVSTERTNEIEEIASDWLIRRQSGQWSEADQGRLEQWLEASTSNRVAYLRLELAWEDSARLKALGAGIPGDLPPPPGRWNLTPFFDTEHTASGQQTPDPGPVAGDAICAPAHDHGTVRTASHRPRRRVWFSALAASVLLAAAIGGYIFLIPPGDRYSTPVGGLASVPMRDGSKVTLNTNSRIRVALSEGERRVHLTQGEAFFEVAKDPRRPFVVEAGRKRVVAVGTKFSVRREEESIEVVVTEGKVRVEDAAGPLRDIAAGASGSATPEGSDGPVFLTRGAIARADGPSVLVQRKSLPEAETRLSWRSGVLMFREQSLAGAVAEFNRYNVRQIVIADPAVAALRVEGNFRATNVDAFVRLLESGFPVRAAAAADQIVLSSR
jgi:transmembrane sensor